MIDILSLILFGVTGGIIRAFIGIAKYLRDNRKGSVRPWYLIFTVFTAAAVGGLAGVLTDGSWQLALIAGYAGSDFLEGLYKIQSAKVSGKKV